MFTLAEDLVDLAEHPLAADRAEAEADVEQAQHVEVIQAFHPLAVLAQLAGGVDAADHRAHGTTGDAGDLIAACLEFLDHADARVAARTAGAQYQGDLFAHLQPLPILRDEAKTIRVSPGRRQVRVAAMRGPFLSGDRSMKTWIVLPVPVLTLAGCAGKTAYRENCADQLDAAWKELDLAKAEGFAGTVSYSKALTLLTGAKTQQQFEAYEGCTSKAEKARFISASRAPGAEPGAAIGPLAAAPALLEWALFRHPREYTDERGDPPDPVQPRRRLRLQDFAQGTGGDPRRQRRAEPRSEALGRQRLARRRGCLRPRRGARGGLHHRFLHADRRRPFDFGRIRRDQRHQRYLRHGRRPADGHRHPRLAGQRAGRGSRPRGDRRRPQGLRGSRHPAGRRTLHRRPRADLSAWP